MKNNVFPNMGCHDYTVLFTSILVYCHLDTAGASSLNNTCSPFPSPTHMPKKRRGKKSDPISTVETFPFEKRGMPSIFRNNSCQIDTNNSGRASYTLYYGRLSKCRLCRHDFLDFTPMGNQGFAASIPNNTWISLLSSFWGTSMETDLGSGKKSILVKFRSHLTHLWESENIWMTSNPNRGLCKIWALFEKAGGGGVPMSILALLKAKKGKGKRIATRTDGVDFELLYPCRFI